MSVKALDAVFDHSEARGAAYVALLAMADWADQSGRCHPSYNQIAAKARISRAKAIQAIEALIGLGEIERVIGGYAPDGGDTDAPETVRSQWRNEYRILLMRRRVQVVEPDDHPRVDEVPPRVVHPHDHLEKQVVNSEAKGGLVTPPQVVNSEQVHIGIDRQFVRPSVVRPSDVRAGALPLLHPVENPDDNVRVITRIAHEVMDQIGPQHDDLTESVKGLCARRRIAYNSTVVAKAIESARWQRRQKEQAS